MSTKALIYAIVAGKYQEAEAMFKEAVATRQLEAIDAKRVEVAQTMFTTPVAEGVELEEHVSHDDINNMADSHADSHVNWGQYRGHAQRHSQLEDHIKERHGEKALKHVQKHSEAQMAYAKSEDSEHGTSKEDYEKIHKPAMEKHMKAAQDASAEHQKTTTPRRLTRHIVRQRLGEEAQTVTKD